MTTATSNGRATGSVPLKSNEIAFIDALRRSALAPDDAQELSESRGVTQQDLERITGLSRTSVANVVSRFESLMVEVDGPPEAGRHFALDPEAGVIVAVDFGHRHWAVALGDLYGRIYPGVDGRFVCAEGTYPEVDRADGPIAIARRTIEEMLEELGRAPSEVVGVAIALPGPVDGQDENAVIRAATSVGTRFSSPFQTVKVGVHLRQELARRDPAWRHVPFLTDNDANLSALADATWGIAREERASNAVFLEWSRGVGGALVLAGEIFRGGGAAGELGHIPVHPSSAVSRPRCERCGNESCLENLIGLDALLEQSGLKAPGEPYGSYESAVDDLIRLAETETAARATLDRAGECIAQVLAPLITALNPELVVIGGGVGARLYDHVKASLHRHLDKLTMPVANKDVTVLGARTRNGSGAERRDALFGALALVLERHGERDPLVTFVRRKAAHANR